MILTTVSFDRDSLLLDLKNRINVLEAMDTIFFNREKNAKDGCRAKPRRKKQILIIIKSDEFIRGIALGPDPTIKR